RTIPIVFTNLADPVGTGLVRSLARPGGNATGFTAFEYSLAGKWLEMLKEIAPAVTRVAVLFNPETAPFAQLYLTEPRTILAFGSGCSARAEVSPRSGARFDAWPASARSFARCHTESTRERTQAGAAAIRSS